VSGTPRNDVKNEELAIRREWRSWQRGFTLTADVADMAMEVSETPASSE
jgi:hypothetical protein